MKQIHLKFNIIVTVIFAVILMISCSKEVDIFDNPSTLNPGSLDENAGNWKMIVLSSPDQIPVAAPSDINSDNYKSELTSIKSLQAVLTPEQKNIIDYWKSGGIIRWNQIMRELVARFNLPPEPVNNQFYPGPDVDNPFADPAFPFANPPYAVRAYSYVSVGQYEALKAAWHYKFLYNRPSPCKVDNSILALMPVSDLPSYPSEEAVMSGVTAEILKAMFPAAVEEISRMAGEQRNAALWSGKATASDITAGLALGKAVAALIMARAATDGMKNSVGNPPVWQAYADSATARGEVPWHSLETPKRPPMLPLFWQVKGWIMTYNDIVKERPGPPPSTSSEKMKMETEEVKNTVNNITRDQLAIALKWNDGVGTSCPPGHWNDIATIELRKGAYSEVRDARAYALLNMAMHDAAIACWDAKFHYFNPRAVQLDPSIKTVIGMPNFPSYTSGHSTFSASAATVLAYLFPDQSDQFYKMADEAAISRLYAGIHYRADIEVGKANGKVVGSYTVNWALTDGSE